MKKLYHALNKYAITLTLTSLFVACTSVPESFREYENSEGSRFQQVRSEYTNKTLALQQVKDYRGLVNLSVTAAERYRTLGAPLLQAESLATARSYAITLKDLDSAERYAARIQEILLGISTENSFDRNTRESTLVSNAVSAADLALQNGNKTELAKSYVDVVKSNCAKTVNQTTLYFCKIEEAGGARYRSVLAKLGDPTAQSLENNYKQREKAEIAELNDLASKFLAAQTSRNHLALTQVGAALNDRLAKQYAPFLIALIEIDRAEAYRLLGDKTSNNAALNVVKRTISSSGGLAGYQAEHSSELAKKIGLIRFAQVLQNEATAINSLNSTKGLDSFGLAFATPSEIQETRTALLKALDQLQSRNAYLSAEWVRIKLQETAEQYEKRVAEIASERAAAQQQRADDQRRSKEGLALLQNAIGYMGTVSQSPNQNKSVSAANASNSVRYEECKCGPDYIPCWVRNAKKSGSRYQVSGNNIVIFDKDGGWGTKKGWDGSSCSAIVR